MGGRSKKKKLRVKKEVLRKLTTPQLEHAQGGIADRVTHNMSGGCAGGDYNDG
jgi:hypothetical protein